MTQPVSQPMYYSEGTVPEEVRKDTTYLPALLRRTSWGAVLAGATVAIAAQIFFTLLGIALGMTASEVTRDPAAQVTEGVAVTAAAWWLISGTLSLFLGGLVVGRFAGLTRSPDVILHSLTMWSTTAVFGLVVVSLAGTTALYGTGLNSMYLGSNTSNRQAAENHARRIGVITVSQPLNTLESNNEQTVTPAQATKFVRTASWWAVLAFMLGIGASLVGSWITTPERIVMKPPAARH